MRVCLHVLMVLISSYEPCVVAFVHLVRSQSPSRVLVCLMRVGMCWWSLLRTLQSLSRCACAHACCLWYVCVSICVCVCVCVCVLYTPAPFPSPTVLPTVPASFSTNVHISPHPLPSFSQVQHYKISEPELNASSLAHCIATRIATKDLL